MFGRILALLFIGLKSTKILASAGSMLLAMAANAYVFGWPFAVGFILLLFFHEIGHYAAARIRGLDVGLPTFIPFLGAFIKIKEKPHNVETEAYVAFAGPLVGSIAAAITYVAAIQLNDKFLLTLASTGFLLNLFNLLPVSPLDGGRITAALSPRIWLAGAPMIAVGYYYLQSPILLIVAILAIPYLVEAWKFNPAEPANRAYYGVSTATRVTYAALYVGLAIILSFMIGHINAIS